MLWPRMHCLGAAIRALSGPESIWLRCPLCATVHESLAEHFHSETHMGEVLHLVRASKPRSIWQAKGLFFTVAYPGGFVEVHAVIHEYRVVPNGQYLPPDLDIQVALLDRPRWKEVLRANYIARTGS